jgi:glycosyltransferase involved in cell wall biosynthesis
MNSPGSQEPGVSVIITSRSRPQFLEKALDSVLSQNLGSETLEILVSKNFAHPRIDNLAAAGRIVSISSDYDRMGPQLLDAVVKARSSLVAFLDDDDVWETNRLRHILQIFRNEPRLGFYSNSQLVIDENDRPLPARRRNTRRREMELTSGARVRISPKDLTIANVAEIAALELGNCSSIVIRKDVVLSFADSLKALEYGTDHFLFFAALLSAHDMMIEYLPLTRYRVHPENLSRISRAGYGSFWIRYRSLVAASASGKLTLLAMARHSGSEAATRYLRRTWRRHHHFQLIVDTNTTRRMMASWLVSIFRSDNRKETTLWPVPVFLSGITYIVWPQICRVSLFVLAGRVWSR